jgi:hypothetical protein
VPLRCKKCMERRKMNSDHISFHNLRYPPHRNG